MRRPLALAVVFAAVLVSGCAVGDPKPATYVTDVSVTLNGDVYSSVSGDTDYFWRYGETSAYDSATPHRTIAISDAAPHPVSEPLAGLTAGTTYHYALCVADGEESPPRVNCSTDRTFTTGTEAGTSGIAFSRASTIWRMGAGGEDPVALTDQGARAWPAWSPDGRRIAFTSQVGSTPGIVAMDADGGNQVNLTPDSATEFAPQWSPDGSRIVFFSDGDGDPEIYVMDTDGGNVVQLTDNDTFDQWPSWSPDGRRIVFSARRENPNDQIFVMNADGTGAVQLTDTESLNNIAPKWSPDGRKIAFTSDRDFNNEVYVMDSDGGNETNLTNSGAFEALPTWSPDGSKIAFQSISGQSEILVMDADGSDVTNITDDPATDETPAWSPRP